MANYFTHYWNKNSWTKSQARAGILLEYLGGNQFRKRRVKKHDTIYPVTVAKGRCYVCARIVVGPVAHTEQEAARLRGNREGLYPRAKDHLFSSQSTPMHFDVQVPYQIARNLRFVSAHGPKALKFVTRTKLYGQALRGVRQLERTSASLLDNLLPALSPIHVGLSIRKARIARLGSVISNQIRNQRKRNEMLAGSLKPKKTGHGGAKKLPNTGAGERFQIIKWKNNPFALSHKLPGSFESRKK